MAADMCDKPTECDIASYAGIDAFSQHPCFTWEHGLPDWGLALASASTCRKEQSEAGIKAFSIRILSQN